MRRSKGEKVFNVFNIILMLLFAVIMIYPYLNQLAYSLNDGMDSMRGGLTILPRVFTLANYKQVLSNSDTWNAAAVTVLRVVIYSMLALATTYMAAYVLSRKGLPYRKIMSVFLLIPSYLTAGVIPTYLNMRSLHLIDSFWVYVLPGGFIFYYMVIIRSFLQDIPDSLEESAKIDGANDFLIMLKIILPLSKPVVATIVLWLMVQSWNDWNSTLLYITDKKLFTLQYQMMRLIKETGMKEAMNETATFVTDVGKNDDAVTSEGIKSATLIITTLPIIMVYPFLQKYFIKGITLGAVKG